MTLIEQARLRAAYIGHHDPRTAQLLTQLADTIDRTEDSNNGTD